jgi:hypothetical protein
MPDTKYNSTTFGITEANTSDLIGNRFGNGTAETPDKGPDDLARDAANIWTKADSYNRRDGAGLAHNPEVAGDTPAT